MNNSTIQKLTQQHIEDFEDHFGQDTLNLAAYAALPVALNTEFLHLLRLNFSENLDYTAEMNLLLSPLCTEIGPDLYELEPAIRNFLLARLWNQGEERLRQVAALLGQYSQRLAPWADRPYLELAQFLTAQIFLDRTVAKAWLDQHQAGTAGVLSPEVDPDWFIAMYQELERTDPVNLKSNRIADLLRQAAKAERAFRWDEAQQCYKDILKIDSGYPEALAALERLGELSSTERRMLELTRIGNTQMQNGDYKAALATFNEALLLAEQVGLLIYEVDLEKKCNLARKLDEWQKRIKEVEVAANQLSRQGNWDAALAPLNELRAELPQDPVYADIAAQLDQTLQAIERQNQGWPPDYAPELFVNRLAEIERVLKKVEVLRTGSSLEKRTIVFTGTRGMGKTWLLAHVRTQLEAMDGVTVFTLNLANYTGSDPTQSMLDILRRFGAAMHQSSVVGETPVELGRNLIALIPKGQPLILLLDSVYQTNWSLLIELEECLFASLAIQPNVLIVMTGRGRPYSWKTPELRLLAEFVELQPFSTVTDEQLEHLQGEPVPNAAKIHEFSGGNPLANRILANYSNPIDGLNEAVQEMLADVPDEFPSGDSQLFDVFRELLANTPNSERRTLRDYVRDCFEALCVLRSFDNDERIGRMLAAYYESDGPNRGWTKDQAQQVRDKLVIWDFAQIQRVHKDIMIWGLSRWGEKEGGFVLDDSTRHLAESYLKNQKSQVWAALHQAAAALYTQWAGKYRKQQNRWEQEAEYHRRQVTERKPIDS